MEGASEKGLRMTGKDDNHVFLSLLQDTQHQVELCGQELCPGQNTWVEDGHLRLAVS